MKDLTQCYRLLGLEFGASLEEINQAYRDLVFIWHPDRIPSDNQRLRQKAQEKIQELNYARDQLRSYLQNRQPRTPSIKPPSSSPSRYHGSPQPDSGYRKGTVRSNSTAGGSHPDIRDESRNYGANGSGFSQSNSHRHSGSNVGHPPSDVHYEGSTYSRSGHGSTHKNEQSGNSTTNPTQHKVHHSPSNSPEEGHKTQSFTNRYYGSAFDDTGATDPSVTVDAVNRQVRTYRHSYTQSFVYPSYQHSSDHSSEQSTSANHASQSTSTANSSSHHFHRNGYSTSKVHSENGSSFNPETNSPEKKNSTPPPAPVDIHQRSQSRHDVYHGDRFSPPSPQSFSNGTQSVKNPYPDLRGQDLRGANFKEKDLSGGDLSQTDLTNADLSDAFLHNVNLEESNLSKANLFRANLLRANLRRANLSEANLFGADLSGADLTEADLRGAKMGVSGRIMVKLTGACLKGTILPDGSVHS